MATIVTAPEKCDLIGKVSVFLAGSIDQGSAPRWDLELIESLADVECVVLNPRRKDWDSSWVQSIDNPQFREQVEWELYNLEQCSLIALCLTKDSKAPISLLELGLHVAEGKMVVYCPDGFYRKGNVDIVCARYGVKVIEDFEEFKSNIRDQLLVTAVVRTSKTASDRMAWRIMAREFIIAMRKEVCMAATVKEGDICTVNASYGTLTSKLEGHQLKILRDVVRQGGGKVVVEEVQYFKDGDLAMVVAYDNPASAMIGAVQVPCELLRVVGHTAASNHKDFPTRKEALAWLEDHAMMSVGWREGSKDKVAIYWNGKLTITDADTKRRWSSDDQVSDPMAGEKMSSLFMALHTWATRKATSLPPGAPVATQILDGLNAVEEALKGKMGLRGREAVVELLKAAKNHFTMDAPPFPALIRRYGMDEMRQVAGRFFARTAIDWNFNEALRRRYAPNSASIVPPASDVDASFVPIKTESQKQDEERRRGQLKYRVPRKAADDDKQVVFYARSGGGRWEIFGYSDGSFEEKKSGRSTASGGKYSSNALQHRLAAIIQDSRIIDGITYKIEVDKLGVGRLLQTQDSDELSPKEWLRTAGMGDTHQFGSSLRRRRDYGERDGDADVANKMNNIEEQMPTEGIMTSRNMRARNMVAFVTPPKFRVWEDMTDKFRKAYPNWDEDEIPDEVLYNKEFNLTISINGSTGRLEEGYPITNAPRNIKTISDRDYASLRDDPLHWMIQNQGAKRVAAWLEDRGIIRRCPTIPWDRILGLSVTASDNLRVRVIEARIVASAKEFLGGE